MEAMDKIQKVSRKNLIILAVSLVIIIIVGASLYWSSQNQPEKYAGPVEEVRLSVSEFGPQLNSLIYIAQNKGYFADNKLRINLTVEKGVVAVRKAVANGVEDFGTSSDFGFVSDSFTIKNLRVLAVISNTQLIEVIGRKDKGIMSASDLKGKKIAVTIKSFGQFYFGLFLVANSLKPSDVTLVPINFDKMKDAIVAGDVDAAVSNDPYAYEIKQALGENAVVLQPLFDRNNNLLLISTKEVVKSRPAVMERFLAALLQAEEFVKTNPDESKRIIAEQFKLDPVFLNQSWQKNTFELSLKQTLILEMEDEARWSIENNLTTTEIPNYLDFFYFDALEKVNPEAISIIR